MTFDLRNYITPIEKRGKYFFKRDDKFEINGAFGGKVRACWQMAQNARGLVCASSRRSPQASIVARVAEELGIPCLAHIPNGETTAIMQDAIDHGITLVREPVGRTSVIVARAKEHAGRLGWTYIPWGMESEIQVSSTANQVKYIDGVNRIVVPTASGVSLAGILRGLADQHLYIPVVAVCVYTSPKRILNKWAPEDWPQKVTLVQANYPFHLQPKELMFEGIKLDPVYEAKCVEFLEPGDLFWIVGRRAVFEEGQS